MRALLDAACIALIWMNAAASAEEKAKPTKTIYPKETQLDYQGLAIEGEVRNPGELYFQHREEEKFDSLLKRRKNFHEQMLRDVMLSR